MIDVAASQARDHGLESVAGLYVAMTFLLGWSFMDNPVFEWASSAVAPLRASGLGSLQRGRALHGAGLRALDRAFSLS